MVLCILAWLTGTPKWKRAIIDYHYYCSYTVKMSAMKKNLLDGKMFFRSLRILRSVICKKANML